MSSSDVPTGTNLLSDQGGGLGSIPGLDNILGGLRTLFGLSDNPISGFIGVPKGLKTDETTNTFLNQGAPYYADANQLLADAGFVDSSSGLPYDALSEMLFGDAYLGDPSYTPTGSVSGYGIPAVASQVAKQYGVSPGQLAAIWSQDSADWAKGLTGQPGAPTGQAFFNQPKIQAIEKAYNYLDPTGTAPLNFNDLSTFLQKNPTGVPQPPAVPTPPSPTPPSPTPPPKQPYGQDPTHPYRIINPQTGYADNPQTGNYFDQNGMPITQAQYNAANPQQPAAPNTYPNRQIDPQTGYQYNPGTGNYFDNSGMPITQAQYDQKVNPTLYPTQTPPAGPAPTYGNTDPSHQYREVSSTTGYEDNPQTGYYFDDKGNQITQQLWNQENPQLSGGSDTSHPNRQYDQQTKYSWNPGTGYYFDDQGNQITQQQYDQKVNPQQYPQPNPNPPSPNPPSPNPPSPNPPIIIPPFPAPTQQEPQPTITPQGIPQTYPYDPNPYKAYYAAQTPGQGISNPITGNQAFNPGQFQDLQPNNYLNNLFKQTYAF